MAEVQTSEMDAYSATVNLGLSRVNFDNHGNQKIFFVVDEAILVQQWVPYLDPPIKHCNKGR
jgi:hypothetical protein